MTRRIASLAALLWVTGVAPQVFAQDLPLIDDDFDEVPCCTRAEFDAGECELGWICQGNTAWIPPDADECNLDLDGDGTIDPNVFDQFTSFDPANPCTEFPGEGYVLVTPAVTNMNGSMFRTERILYDNFKLTAEVELRNGSIGRPADGMCIVIVGTDDPPQLGAAGGAMGATGLGAVPTMIFEFDNWSCNNGDNNDQNHVQFAYSATGFQNTDAIPIRPAPFQGIFKIVDEALYPLNNRLPPPTESNRFLFEVIVQKGTVACFLTNNDVGLDRTSFYVFTIPGFEAFEGFLGVTGSTGGAWQNQILHSIKIEEFDGCLAPPALATRDLKPTRNPEENNGDYQAGDVVDVDITLSQIRVASANCSAAVGVVLKETPPAGWTPSAITDSGSFNAGTGEITWTLTGASFTNGKKVSYKATVPNAPETSVRFTGTTTENIALSESSGIVGEDTLVEDAPFDACGGIRGWNILGGFNQAAGAGPAVDMMRLDYLTDGNVTEFDFVWFPGAQVSTAFNGDGISGSLSTGLNSGTTGRNPGGIPTVFAHNDIDGRINLNDDVFGGNPENVMAYAQVYVINTTGAPIDGVHIASSSDDSIQIILNGQEAWIHSIPRGGSDACAPQDRSPDGSAEFPDTFTLEDGENILIVKVFEGGGAWEHAIRFEDDDLAPITEGLEISKFPISGCVKAPLVATRTLDTGKTVDVLGQTRPAWEPGDTYTVNIALSDLRAASTGCVPPTTVTIEEIVPEGWTPSAPSAGGTVVGRTVRWNLTGGTLVVPGNLTYQVATGGSPGGQSGRRTVLFAGGITDPGSIASFFVKGDKELFTSSDFSGEGFIQQWLLLGPYRQPGVLNLDAPGETRMREDHLKDNLGITEVNVTPRAGDTVMTAFGPGAGKARSIGLTATSNGINPGGVPTWSAWQDSDDLIAFENYYGGDLDRNMMYAVTYIDVAAPINVALGLASDDSIQVLLDGDEVAINNIARGSGLPNEVQDIVPLGSLAAGRHRLMVKVFEGLGGHNFRLRFQDPTTAEPITEGITVCLSPVVSECGSGGEPVFHRGDADDNGALQLTDALRILGFLFLGGPPPTCLDAGDADDNGGLQLTDALRILGFLFLGGPPPSSPGPPGDACGPDPTTDDVLDCLSYTNC